MKKQIMIILLIVLMIQVNIAKPETSGGGSGSGSRRFFDGTFPIANQTENSVFLKTIPDYSIENGEITLNITLRTKTSEWTVKNAKDLFIEVSILEQANNSQTKLFMADVYSEQVVIGGRFNGMAFDQATQSIGDYQLPEFNSVIPYRTHLGFDACPFEYYSDHYSNGAYYQVHRMINDAEGLQINLEFQIFGKSSDNSSIYQDYVYIAFDNQFTEIEDQADITVIKETETSMETPGFTIIPMFFGLIIFVVILKKK